MINDVSIVVVTGGPCAGKSTGLSRFRDFLASHGYHVLMLSEIATELITAGCDPVAHPVVFQELVLKRTRASLHVYADYFRAVYPAQSKKVIICDRCYLDGKAYCTQEEWRDVCIHTGFTEAWMTSQVDLVIHLVTAAYGAEAYYTCANNTARREGSIEEARLVEERTKEAWLAHPSRFIIGNEVGFNEKIRRATACLARRLNVPEPKEIEEKFLITSSREEIMSFLAKVPHTREHIVQTYLVQTSNGTERRVRKSTSATDHSVTYRYTEKVKTNEPNTRIERERVISQATYNRLLSERDCNTRDIIKWRNRFDYHNRRFELDMLEEPIRVSYLEIELGDQGEQFELPPVLSYKKVTGDDSHSMHHIACGSVSRA